MFVHELSDGRKVLSFYPQKVVEFSDWAAFVAAEEVYASAKTALEGEWEAWLASHESVSPELYWGSENERAYKAHRSAVQALEAPAFLGAEPLEQGPIQAWVPQAEWRVHAAYGGWDLRRSLRHPAVRPARAEDSAIMTEREAWAAAVAYCGVVDFNGDMTGTFESRVDI